MPLVLSGSTGIVEANIADSAITNSKVASLAASKLTGQVADANIAAVAAAKLTGQIADANANSGAVLQVVQTVVTGPITFNGTLADAISVSITPSSTNSKILVQWDTVWGRAVDTYGAFYLYKNGSKMYGASGDATNQDFQRATGAIMNRGSGQDMYVTHSNSGRYLDSPSTTSAITYAIKANTTYGGSIHLNRADFVGNTGYQIRSISTLTVTEIAG
jgi:hypothetical protein